ncbi:DNA-directed RNA polymerase III subunit RPC3 [Gonapodya sp. JEL0774]|nr:DNA-directed RNA polymerase III subunit RPC3 [Gonapodya sp. JEL0774]
MTARVQLAAEIIKETFGLIPERVATTLLLKGRLTIGGLVNHTKLPARQVRESLFVLIQHNLMHWIESTEGQRVVTHYNIEEEEVLARLRLPLHAALVRTLFGNDAALLVEQVIKNGRMKAPEPHWDDPLLHGRPPSALRKAWVALTEDRIIVRVTQSDATSMADRIIAGEAASVSESLVPTANEKKKAKTEAESKAREQRYGGDVHVGTKRKWDGQDNDDAPYKRLAVSDMNGSYPTAQIVETNDESFWRLNHDRLNVLARSEVVAELAASVINPSAGKVAAALMQLASEDIKGCKFEERSRTFMFNSLPIADNLELPLIPVHGIQRPSLQEYVDLLEENECHFVEKSDSGMGGQYFVDFRKLSVTLRRVLVERVVENRFGHASLRIFRLLQKHGKLDDKQIARIAMLRDKEVRTRTYELFSSGFVQQQEVPRGSDRSALKTFFLWFVNLDLTCDMLRSYVVETCRKIMVRHQSERALHRLLLEKLERQQGDLQQLPEAEEAGYRTLETSFAMLEAAVWESLFRTPVPHMSVPLEITCRGREHSQASPIELERHPSSWSAPGHHNTPSLPPTPPPSPPLETPSQSSAEKSMPRPSPTRPSLSAESVTIPNPNPYPETPISPVTPPTPQTTGDDLLVEHVLTRKSYYDVLGVTRECTTEDIRKAYLGRSRTCHPDRCSHPRATEAFQCLATAYETLRQPTSRRLYDLQGEKPSTLSNPDETFSTAMAQVVADFLEGNYDSIIALVEQVRQTNTDLNVSPENVREILSNFHTYVMTAAKCYDNCRTELTEIYDSVVALRDLPFFDVIARISTSVRLLRALMALPVRINESMDPSNRFEHTPLGRLTTRLRIRMEQTTELVGEGLGWGTSALNAQKVARGAFGLGKAAMSYTWNAWWGQSHPTVKQSATL